jgi:predicted dehydrogenase
MEVFAQAKRQVDKILIVGSGSIGLKHLGVIKELLPNCQVAFLHHSTNKKIIVGADKSFFSIENAFEYAADIVVLANPSSFHIELARKLMRPCVKFLIEKPISNSTYGLNNFLEECNAFNANVTIGYNLRYLDSLNYFRNQIKNDLIGKVHSIRAEVGQNLATWREGVDYKNTSSASSYLGGGVLLELSHEIDYLLWIFGGIEWVQSSIFKHKYRELDVEDTSLTIINFNNIDNNRQISCSLNMDFMRHDSVRNCYAIGDKSTLLWDGVNGIVSIFNPDISKWNVLFHATDELTKSYINLWKAIIEMPDHPSDSKATIKDGIDVLMVVEAIKKSSKDEERVYLNRSAGLFYER